MLFDNPENSTIVAETRAIFQDLEIPARFEDVRSVPEEGFNLVLPVVLSLSTDCMQKASGLASLYQVESLSVLFARLVHNAVERDRSDPVHTAPPYDDHKERGRHVVRVENGVLKLAHGLTRIYCLPPGSISQLFETLVSEEIASRN